MTQSIVHVALVVRDYDEAIEFYTKKLDFALVEDTYQPEQDKRWVVVAPPGSQGTTLVLARASKAEQETFVGNQTGGRVFLFLNTDDFWRDYNRMIARGITFIRPPKAESYGTVAVFRDLYGNLWDLLGPREAPVEIVPYDPSWPDAFDDEAKRLGRTLAPWLVGTIEHIGSTAVPGLAAKPVIDVMAAVETLDVSRPAIAALADLGYCYFPYRADSEHWFCKPSLALRTHHLHLIPFDSPRWREAIVFRDYLRSHSQAAAEYSDLKHRLAKEFQLTAGRQQSG